MTNDTFHRGIAARTIYGEARSEAPEGMDAVAHVILNRLNDGRWGNTYGLVCMAPWQFSCWNSNDPNRHLLLSLPDEAMELAYCFTAVDFAAIEPDHTEGATHYYNPDAVTETPSWVAGATLTVTIGHHRFYKGVK